jgi:hypothetical protein
MLYSEVKKLRDGRYYTKASKEDGSRVIVQLNNVIMMSRFADADNVMLDVTQSRTKIESIDTNNIEAAKTHSTEWFGKEMSEKTLEAAYTRVVSQDNEFNVKKVHSDVKVYDPKRNEIDPESLKEGDVCDVVLEFSGLIFSKKSFSPHWKLIQVKYRPPPKKAYVDYMFEDEEEAQADTEEDDFE